jgi:CRP/FNR family cyclic AMP-dependent transcriptional regulator
MEHELLKGLSSTEVDQVLALGTRITVPSGGTLFRLGDPADHLYLVERGRIRLTSPMMIRHHEEEVFIEEKSPGEIVGWSALVPPYRLTLSATAPLETELIALPREALSALCEGSPVVGARIGLNLAIVIAHRLQLVQAMWMREIERTVEMKSTVTSEVR